MHKKLTRLGRIVAAAASLLIATASPALAVTTIGTDITTDGVLTINGNAILGDAATDLVTINGTLQGATALVFEGATADAFETSLAITDPTVDRTITIPNASLTVAGIDLAQSWSAAQTFNGGITTATFSVNPATKDPIIIAPLTGSSGDFSGTITSANITSSNKTWTFPDATGNVVLDGATQTLTGKTLTSPRIGTSILDTNGNELMLLTATASAVNEMTLENGATGNPVKLSATGDDAAVNFQIHTKGANSDLIVSNSVASMDRLRIRSQSASGSGTFDGIITTADLTTATKTWTFPDRNGTVSLSGDTFTGDVTGTLNTSGATALTIASDSVALTTDTTGNYVTSVGTSVLTGLTGGAAASEGATLTLALDYSQALSGDVGLAANAAVFGQSGLVFEGATANTFESFISITDPTADQTYTFPDASGTVTLGGNTFTGTGSIVRASAPTLSAAVTNSLTVTGNIFDKLAALTAAGGGQGGAQQIADDIAAVTVNVNGDGVRLPATFPPGLRIQVINLHATNALNVFPSTGDTINALGANNAYSLPGYTSLFCVTTTTDTAWQCDRAISTTTGSGAVVLATSPTLVTPTLGVATATSINGLTITSSTGTLTIAAAKTLTASNSLTLAGTDGTTMTFPSASGNVVTEGATQTLTSKTLRGTFTLFDTATATDDTIKITPYVGGGARYAGILTTADLASVDRTYTFPDADGTVTLGGNTFTGTGSVVRATAPSIATLTLTGTSPLTLTQTVATTGSPVALTLTGAAHTTLAAGTEASDVNLNLARTVEFSAGALTTQRAVRIAAPTYGFTGASTLTNAATLAISGAPAAGTNATITNAYAVWVQGGKTQLDGNLTVSTGGVTVTGNSTITGTLGGLTALTVASGLTTLGGDLTFSGTTARTITGPGTGGLTMNVTSGPLTLSTTTSGTLAATSAGALNLTGAAASTWDIGNNLLSLQTTGNGAITTGTGTFTTGGLTRRSVTTGITAGTTQTQAGATALTTDINNVATVGTTGDGVRLPAGAIGLEISVINRGANSLNLYPAVGGTINALAQDAAYAVATLVEVRCTFITATVIECQKMSR